MANVNTAAPKLSKNRKLGKNKKKAWRAAKIADLEDFLDDERRQKESGGLVSEKGDNALFVLDTKKHITQKPVLRSKKSYRNKPLRCHALLLPNPNSKTVRKPETCDFQKGKRPQRILERLRERCNSRVRVDAEAQRQKSVKVREETRAQKRKLPEVTSDYIWGDDVGDGKKKVKPPKEYHKKPSALRATLIPHPGASINPTFEDHQDLLRIAIAIEQKKVKDEKRLYNALQKQFPTKANAPDINTFISEMSAGLFDDSDEDGEDKLDSDNGDVSLSVNPPVRRENKKTRKQRRTQEKLLKEAEERQKVVKHKRRENMVFRIPTLKSEINKEVAKQKEKAIVKRQLKENEPYQTKKLGRVRYEDADPDLKMSTELVGSLREVEPEGHLLQDMYKSLLKRNIMEPRVKQKSKRTYKLKVFERKGHKAVTL